MAAFVTYLARTGIVVERALLLMGVALHAHRLADIEVIVAIEGEADCTDCIPWAMASDLEIL